MFELTYITEIVINGLVYTGPRIEAKDIKDAKDICKDYPGCKIIGKLIGEVELSDYICPN